MREDMKCLKCGETERFDIAATCWAVTWPDGAASTESIEWDAGSTAICGNCQKEGTVGGFAAMFNDHITTLKALGAKTWPAIEGGKVVCTTPIDMIYTDVLNDARREQD